MARSRQILLGAIFLLSWTTATHGSSPTNSTIEEEELVPSESKDGKLEIVKRIKKVNPDGSYTIGYEADDGSFKIESRDVLGNVKGTYGFVDDDGEVKRVSYSSSNASEIFGNNNSIGPITTRNPTTYSTTTPSSPTTTVNSVIQSIARRRASSTTAKPNYKNIETIRSTPTPRVLLQRPSISSVGQISRPEGSEKPTDLPTLRRLPLKKFEDVKPVTEEASEIRNNILRRQLPQEEQLNPQNNVYSFQQSSAGNDVADIYNSGATASSRPLFTTSRPGRISPIAIPTKYASNYQRVPLQEVESNQYSQQVEESPTSTEQSSTSIPVPSAQIPPNRVESQEPLVAIKHPFQKGVILVPLSQLQGRIVPVDNMQEVQEARRYYNSRQQQSLQSFQTPDVEIERQNIKTFNPSLRSLPVRVDEEGFVRKMPQEAATSYPRPISVAPRPEHVTIPIPRRSEIDVDDDLDKIHPPVSTRDFQKLLHHLIVRQKRLEKISELTNQPPPVRVVPAPSAPYFLQRVVPQAPQEVDQTQIRSSTRQYVAVNPRARYNYQPTQVEESLPPPRAPLTVYRTPRQNQLERPSEEYLPAHVREMLLLRMLQLAMNPALPIDDEEDVQSLATMPAPQYKRAPVRNVEILGEEEEEIREPAGRKYRARSKRFKEEMMDYAE